MYTREDTAVSDPDSYHHAKRVRRRDPEETPCDIACISIPCNGLDQSPLRPYGDQSHWVGRSLTSKRMSLGLKMISDCLQNHGSPIRRTCRLPNRLHCRQTTYNYLYPLKGRSQLFELLLHLQVRLNTSVKPILTTPAS